MGVRLTVVPLVAPTLAFVLRQRLRERDWRIVALGLLATGVCVVSWYVPLIVHTGWNVYRRLMQAQSEYVWRSDPIFVPEIPLASRFSHFFMPNLGAVWIAHTIYLLASIGLIALLRSRRGAAALMILVFVPCLIFSVIINTPMGAVVYSMPYIPFFTGLGACGLVIPLRGVKGGRVVSAVLLIVLATGFALWSLPLLRILRNEESPPVRAAKYLQTQLDPARDVLFFETLFTPHVTFFLGDRRTVRLEPRQVVPESLINAEPAEGRTFVLTAAPFAGLSSRNFHWTRGRAERRLHTLSIGRYFDVYVTELPKTPKPK